MAEIKLEAESRNEFGKGASRRLRRANMIPAVIYGHGTDPVHIALPAHATSLALRQANVLLDIVIDGGTSMLALPKQVQKEPVRNVIEHVDLLLVKRGEKVVVDVPVVIVGEPADKDSQINQDVTSLSVEADATKIPNEIEVTIEGLTVGQQVLAGDVKLPEGTTLAGDPEALVIGIVAQISAEALEASLESPEGEEAPAAEAAESESAEGDAE